MSKRRFKTISPKTLERHVGEIIFLHYYVGDGKFNKEKGVLKEGRSEKDEQMYLRDYAALSLRAGKIPIIHGDGITLVERRAGRGFPYRFAGYVFIDQSD